MSKADIPIHLDLSNSLQQNGGVRLDSYQIPSLSSSRSSSSSKIPDSKPDPERANRRRSNSQSQVIATPQLSEEPGPFPTKRKQVQYFVTLTSLNDTFVTRHISVPYFPETRKLGRPTGAKMKPGVTNGFFDSRVLSRNHAVMFVDPNTGKLMLRDLGSSNGTYINNVKLDTEAVEVNMGDNICFGFNIQVGINHKQISCKVENISIMNDVATGDNELLSVNFPIDSAEYKHYQYIQELYNKISIENRKKELKEVTKKTPVSFESALFSDINPEIEDSLLGLYTKANNGIFKNSGTSTSSKLENSISLLMNCFTKLKQQNNSLGSIETFLETYEKRVNELNEAHLAEQMKIKYTELNDKIANESTAKEKLLSDFKYLRDDNHKKIKKLEEKVFALKDDKSQLNKKITQLTSELKRAEAQSNSPSIRAVNVNEIVASQTNWDDSSKLSLSELDDHSFNPQSQRQQPFSLPKDIPSPVSENGLIMNSSENIETAAQQNNGAHTPPPEKDQNSPSGSHLSPVKVNQKMSDEDTDLRYNQNAIFLAFAGLIFAFIIHHNMA
ncbi:hypothetical protein CANTEDRAFT_117890 [Yamadazyma tenuis ATCC 10573]|uniref:FHA domain-containing protein n=1 Tax=Candida tenuis (strain ATCC 10573 / BCRC 21748 / CBS 615 / JCM 9827 / NBRC 10315 / NRRL Y-1498 / VKM Y-70) TaxID=590646 RepID=G3AX65_CANTC|nr:uncharacterized protein CANTEDRAFT_117890 [Yamadazyma tenuis ATCC 10573]EGV66698.1 hypothetical protein CANTEDRAFT_117890 [Yamadazyma tenuis ATCC 10573]